MFLNKIFSKILLCSLYMFPTGKVFEVAGLVEGIEKGFHCTPGNGLTLKFSNVFPSLLARG